VATFALLAKEYREIAQECRRWAAIARNNQHQRALLEMAKAWTLDALEAEQGTANFKTGKRAQPHFTRAR
jgi:hypothetical protein